MCPGPIPILELEPMMIKTFQWNIGGGKIRKPSDDPADTLSYRNNALDAIIGTLEQYEPDIITLQEAHSGEDGTQAEKIAQKLGLGFWINDVYAESHLEKNQKLSQAIISRFPIQNHSFKFFLNPKLETTGLAGDRWISHDKGVTSCVIKGIGNISLNVKTSHSVPYRKFNNIDPFGEIMTPVRNDMAEKLIPEADYYLYQGDFNYDNASVKSFLPKLFDIETKEVILDRPTTPKGRWYDHVLYRKIQHVKSIVITDVLTDHFPIYSEFEV